MRIVVVDDEPLSRAVVREFAAADADIEIAAECANGFEAVKAVAEHQPDLVLLDVQMPKLDGFEVLELLGRDQPVIFITAYDQYALRAFEVHAVDYLLKPFSAERFELAIERAKARLGERRLPLEAAQARPPEERPQRIVVKDGPKVHVIPLEKLDYLEAQDDYVALHSGGKSYLKQQPIASLEAALGDDREQRTAVPQSERQRHVTFERHAATGAGGRGGSRDEPPAQRPIDLTAYHPAHDRHAPVAIWRRHGRDRPVARPREPVDDAHVPRGRPRHERASTQPTAAAVKVRHALQAARPAAAVPAGPLIMCRCRE